MSRYVLTPDIFDRIDETEVDFGGAIQLTDALQNRIQFMESLLKAKPMTSNKLEWLKTSIEFALDDLEFKNDLVNYMESYS